jgi:ribosomal protein L22
MSAEDEKDVKEDPKDETATKAAVAKKPAAKKAPAEKPAANEPKAEQEAGETKKPAAKKAAAKKTASAEEPKAAKEPKAEKDPKPAKEPSKAAKESAKAKAKPAARRGAKGAEAPRRRVVRAHARYVRTSARKARMVCGHLRGKSIEEARAILAFTPREVARDWSKLLESAVANAESNHELLEDELIVREAYADEGPTIKRFRPRAMGRATPIRKRTSHLTITLTPGS